MGLNAWERLERFILEPNFEVKKLFSRADQSEKKKSPSGKKQHMTNLKNKAYLGNSRRVMLLIKYNTFSFPPASYSAFILFAFCFYFIHLYLLT